MKFQTGLPRTAVLLYFAPGRDPNPAHVLRWTEEQGRFERPAGQDAKINPRPAESPWAIVPRPPLAPKPACHQDWDKLTPTSKALRPPDGKTIRFSEFCSAELRRLFDAIATRTRSITPYHFTSWSKKKRHSAEASGGMYSTR